MKILSAATCAFALLAWASASQSACPTSYVKVFGTESFPAGPTFDHVWAKYDLPAGTIYSFTSAFAYSSNQTIVEANDEYWLEGPASGEPIAFSALVHVTGTAGSHEMKTPNYCSGSGASLTLQSGTESQSAFVGASQCVGHSVDETITLPLQKLPGEVFPLTLRAVTNGSSDQSTIAGVLTFSVPPQYGIRSCQGFHVLPTPVASRSWGSLKVAYR